ncbi:MAG: O-antigen ligase family protein [Acidobacteriota bacterium]
MARFGRRASRRLLDAVRHQSGRSALATACLVTVVLLGPLPFGSVTPLPRALLQTVAVLAFAVAYWAQPRRELLAVVRWPLIALVGIASIGLAQSLRWPAFVAEALSNRIAAAWSEAAALLGESPPSAIALSIAPDVSRHTALHFLAIAACLGAAALQGRERGARRAVAVAFFASAGFQILYGAQAGVATASRIWGVAIPGDPGRLRGTFVNPDHFALYQTIALGLAVGWLWWVIRRFLTSDGKAGPEGHLLRIAPPVLAFGILFVGLAFSGSRAGLLAGIAALFVQAQILAIRTRRWQWGLAAFGGVALGAGALGLFGWRRGIGRWLETSAYEIGWNARLGVWAETLDLWWGSPWLGTGLGTFRQAFPLEQPATLPGTWHHAHSDVLELLATVGPLGVLLLAIALVGLGRRLWQVFRQGRRSEDRAVALGALGAATAVLLHSLVDFGLTIPANAFTLAIVLGLACGVRRLPSETPPRERLTVFLDPDASSEPLATGSDAEQPRLRRRRLVTGDRAHDEQMRHRVDRDVEAHHLPRIHGARAERSTVEIDLDHRSRTTDLQPDRHPGRRRRGQ